ncbi:MAG: type III-B CRISPR-associated protein Cas10/Cmr2, partial [Campylobacterales bacterium]
MERRDFLFLFTITPVQGFIEQSRKLVDLYSSSEILSELTKEGLKVFLERVGKDRVSPIFPAFDGSIEEKRERSYPNRFLVKVEGALLKEVRSGGEEVERVLNWKVKGLWKKFILEGLKKLEKEKRKEIEKIFNYPEIEKKIEEHLEGYFNFYWAIAEIGNRKYKEAFDIVEQRLAGAKNTRFFTQLGGGKGERGRKCNLCGERNVVIYRGREKGSLFLEKEKEALELKHFILKRGEGLCGVCFSKRLKNLGLFSRCRNGSWIGDSEWTKIGEKERHKFPSLYAITYPGYLERREEIEQKLCDFTFRLVKKLEDEIALKLELKEGERAIVEFPKIDVKLLNYKDIPMEIWKEEIKEFFTIESRKKLEKLPEFKKEIKKSLKRFRREFKEY